jgi:O-antigen/teichoic acid export membrane protein
MMNQEDPGWRSPLRGLWRHWIALFGYVMRVRARRAETNGLIVLRSVFLVLVAALLLFVVPLSFIAPWDGGDEGWVPWAVVVIGVASLAYVAWIRRRPLPTNSPEALARSYRALFFIGVGVASAAALWGFVGVFVGGTAWIYLVGLAFGLVGLWMIAPTRSDIERRQREITAAGSPLSLLDALISVPWP